MNRKHAFILSFLITGLIASNVALISTLNSQGQRESVIVARVIDGDTIVLQDARHIRLLNINSPEKGIFNAELAANFLKNYENKSIYLEITGTDKYQRTLARLYNDNEDYLNLELVQLGLASKFLVDQAELGIFSKAEEEAISKGIGIWKKSQYFSCFSSEIDEKQELVFLENKNCGSISMQGFYIKDESRKTYKFGNIALDKSSSITLHSSYGEDSSTDLFWNSKTDIWNNDRDTLYLFDPEGNIAHHEAYGY